MLGNKRDDAEFASALTVEKIGQIDPSDELGPSFSQCGAFLGRLVGSPVGVEVAFSLGVWRERFILLR